MNEITHLLADEAIWQRTFDAVPDLIFILDNQQRIVRANRAAAERLGCRIDELTGRLCHAVMHGTDQPPEFCPHAQLLRDAKPYSVEIDAPRAQGHFTVSATPICGPGGEIVGAVHVARDISEFKRTERELRLAKDQIHQRYALAVASTLDGLWEWDIASGRVEYSPRWETLLGYSREEIPATLDFFNRIVHPEDADTVWATVRGHLADRTPYEIEFRLRTQAGEYRWFQARGQAQWDAAGQPTVMAGAIRDATEQKEAEASLRTALSEIVHLKERLEQENIYLQHEIKSEHDFEEIVGQSEPLRITLHKVEHVAGTDASVLLLGETGSGKELFARAIHQRSVRAAKPLVKVNCAALPASLIESELFGHVKGAFTGALGDKVGRFELANGGTLFLDEIGELDPDLQAKLLRVLQDGEFERIGSNQTIRVDVRLIAATNRNLHDAMRDGSFRPDLYYRLSVFPIEVPPLRARRDDIPLLVWHFITRKQRRLGKNIDSVPREVMDQLVRYDWPGNVRELENVIERAMILSPGSTLVLSETLSGAGRNPGPSRSVPPVHSSVSLQEIDRAHIVAVLDECGWKVKGDGNAAARLGLKPSTLRFRMKKLGIERRPKPR